MARHLRSIDDEWDGGETIIIDENGEKFKGKFNGHPINFYIKPQLFIPIVALLRNLPEPTGKLVIEWEYKHGKQLRHYWIKNRKLYRDIIEWPVCLVFDTAGEFKQAVWQVHSTEKIPCTIMHLKRSDVYKSDCYQLSYPYDQSEFVYENHPEIKKLFELLPLYCDQQEFDPPEVF